MERVTSLTRFMDGRECKSRALPKQVEQVFPRQGERRRALTLEDCGREFKFASLEIEHSFFNGVLGH